MSNRGMYMRRLSSCVGLVAGLALLAGPSPAFAQSAYEKLVAASKAELDKLGGTIKMALDWPDEDAKPVLAEFQKAFPHVKKVDYERETGVDPFGRYLISFKQGAPAPYEVMHIASEYEQQYVEAGIFQKPPFTYQELNASMPADWPKLNAANIDAAGFFVSTTGNSRGIIYNPSIVRGGDIPTKWADCTDPKWKGKVMIDARNKMQAFQFDPKWRPYFMKWFEDLQKNNVVLGRGQAQLVQKVASGEFPIACGVNYHTTYRAIEVEKVTTVKFVMADPIPLEFATRLFVMKSSKAPTTTQLFGLWAITAGQEAIGKFAWRGMPWNPKAHNFEASKGKEVVLCDGECAVKFEVFEKEYQTVLKIPVAGN
ncbi:MAG: extracellular solute-binding protein [Rhodospirillaceae bacterium]|nr:extracellular solute-binding protein [Rhodospirillaceae bacterium]